MDGMSQILVWVVWVAWVLKILTRVKRNDRDQNFIVSETYDFMNLHYDSIKFYL